MSILDEYSFALCLTHDVDRPYKTYQSLYYAVMNRAPRHLLDVLPWREPYWQFERIMDIESNLGVRSAFYFLEEQHLSERPVKTWLDPESWKLYLGRYDIEDRDIVSVIKRLDEGGWEVGIHGSYESFRDEERLRAEKETIESVLGHEVLGGRQHYLNLDRPATWERQASVGLCYDTSLGSSAGFGFEHGYEPIRPFDDEFTVFPLTVMELTLSSPTTEYEQAWSECEQLLDEAKENNAVMTALWHPSYFCERDFPNFGEIYERLIRRALDMGAWVGPPGELYASLEWTDASRPEAATQEQLQANLQTH
jgi:peptidoglycan/xylan/chitin deacetylase (PgdA/CDA1 family)